MQCCIESVRRQQVVFGALGSIPWRKGSPALGVEADVCCKHHCCSDQQVADSCRKQPLRALQTSFFSHLFVVTKCLHVYQMKECEKRLAHSAVHVDSCCYIAY